MTIGIDISQVVYKGTGVGKYVQELVKHLIQLDSTNTYVLFGASLRQLDTLRSYGTSLKAMNPSIKTVFLPIPPTMLDILWNRLHICPITWFTGPLDIFWSSDWTQPPLGSAKGITTIHDVSFFHFPESFDATIPAVQKRRLKWAKRECQHFLCDSKATKNDVVKLLGIDASNLSVIYPGYSPSNS